MINKLALTSMAFMFTGYLMWRHVAIHDAETTLEGLHHFILSMGGLVIGGGGLALGIFVAVLVCEAVAERLKDSEDES